MEIWKDIKGYEGLYQVSNYGRVKSLTRTCKNTNNSIRVVKECILKPKVSGKSYLVDGGYPQVGLSNNPEKRGNKKIHRLVAETFIPNPDNLQQVNHIDGNKWNNNVSNLEWCTNKENSAHAWTNGLINNTKLTQAQVIEIREKYATKKYSQTDLAREYFVSYMTIKNIIIYKSYKNI